MTKKDYVALAKIIRDSHMGTPNALDYPKFMNDLLPFLKADNPRFDVGKFLKACEAPK